MKKIAILGSTGSIGTQTLDIVRMHDDMHVAALSANRNIDLLEAQIRQFEPEIAAVYDKAAYDDLSVRIADTDTRLFCGLDGLIEVATCKQSDLLVTAIVGMIGVRPTIEAICAGKDIALANKETLVTAGHIIMPLAAKHKVNIFPVDSEHSAIFQCIHGEEHSEIASLWITASGGPFRGYSYEQLKNVTVKEAMAHPNWNMGAKITIDSASLVNKTLEVMEARWLFDIPLDDIKVVIQPQSIIHSMVEFVDGAVLAQLGTPDMHLPIQYALCYPHRCYIPGSRLDFTALSGITFEKPDTKTFRGFALGMEAARAGGSMPTVFNAANEEAVQMFLNNRIEFTQIYDILEQAMTEHEVIPDPGLEDILEVERQTREICSKIK